MSDQKITELGKTVGKNIRALRSVHGYNLAFIANRLNISIAALSKIETGVTDANLSRLEQIAHIFEVDIVNLLSRDNTFEPISIAAYNLHEKLLEEKEMEIVTLQRKVIQLYDEIRSLEVKNV